MTPQVLATFREIFEGEERGAAFGLYGAMAGLAAAVGVLGGGLMTDAFGWRSIFYVNVPVAALLVPLTVALVPETRSRVAKRPPLGGLADPARARWWRSWRRCSRAGGSAGRCGSS